MVSLQTYALGAVIEKPVHATGPPATIETVFILRSAPEVETVPWNTAVPPEVVTRKKVAVPVASAELSWVIAFKVKTPPEAPAAKVAEQAR
jgi:hypothetical protein